MVMLDLFNPDTFNTLLMLGRFTEKITSQIAGVKTLANVVIMIVALVFIAKVMIDSIKAFSKKQYNEGVKALAIGIVIAIIAAMGLAGVSKLSEDFRPDGVEFNNSFDGTGDGS